MNKTLRLLSLLAVFMLAGGYASAQSGNITFADTAVKAICVANWDTDSDDELSYAEAAAVTDLGEVFRVNKNISSFEELQYFTGLTSIGSYAFVDCSGLTSVTIPESVTSIGIEAFQNCPGLTSVTIPSSVMSIGEYAFEFCEGLTSLTIPSSVTSIGESAFTGCTGLTSITVDEGNCAYDSRNNCNAIIETATNTLIVGCQNTIIPDGVVSIGNYAFERCAGLTSITIPEGVTSIGCEAFDGCTGLTSITIPEGATSIGDDAFYNCTGLTSVNIPSSVASIGESVFYGCSGLISVTSLIEEPFEIGSDVFRIWNEETGRYEFTTATLYVPAGTKEKYLATPAWNQFQNIVEMEDTNIQFADAAVKAICVENWDTNGDGELSYDEAASVTDLGEVFLGWLHIGNRDITSFDELQFFTGLTSIGDLAFKGCTNLTSVTIPSSVTSIGSSAFKSCNSLTSVTIPSSVTSIGSSAFSGCSSLTGVTIPLNVASIGENAFESCSGLTSITVEEGNEVYDSRNDCNAIIETASNTLIAGCQNTVIPESVTSIGNGAFHGCSGLTSVTIPEGVTSIGNSAFKYCSGLTSISIPESVMSIGEYGFRECTGLTEVTIPGSVSAIGNYAFDLCTGLTSVTILEGVESIGELAFYGCSSLTNVTIPESVTSIDEAAFSGCISLTSITIPESVTIISKDVFSRCSGLTNVTIPSGVTTIEYRAFEDCTSLTSVTIPSSVTSIGKRVFYGCTSLTSVTSLIEEPFEITSDVFENWNDETEQYDFTSATLYVPAGTKEKYLATPAWNQFQNIVEMEDTNIQFADATVKAICVENWDTNGDGELSYDEAATVTTIELTSWFIHTDIISFDELQYFTGLKRIGNQAFGGCTQLKSITIPSSVTNIGNYAFDGCTSLTSVTIPEGVNSIGEYAFRSCSSLANVTIQEGVQSIRDYAFFECSSLTSVTIPKSVTSIGKNPFAYCDKLSSLKVEEGNPVFDSREDCNAIIKTEDNKIISGCTNTVIPNTVTTIGWYTFYGSGLTSISIPHSVTTIEIYSFISNFYLTSITIPNSVTSIFESHGYASMGFSGCDNLTSIIVEEGNPVYDSRNNCNAIIKTADNELIAGCAKTIIPDMVTSIGVGAFYGCRFMSSIEIPKSVTTIDWYAFSFCWGLTSVTIPSSVTSIGWGAFYNCPSLTSVTSLIEEPFEIDSYTFENWNYETLESEFTSATLYVPAGTKEKYEATPAWNQFQNIVEMGLEPVEQGETIDYASDINADTNIDGNTVGDIYYSISSGDGSYDPSEGCIVVTSPTDDDTVNGLSGTDIFGEDFNDHFTGIVFKVAEGKGTIKIEAQTTGSMVLKVKIGDNDPIEMELEGRLKVSFPYNVTEDTYIYIYGGESAAQANSMRRASSDSALKIYGIEIVKGEVDGIGTVMTGGDDDAPVYNLNGQRVKTPHRGVYIQNGKKVLVK